ncbi:MAG: hypothetical protein IMF12_09030 [Proteobacteria bacterium]|nr:hypothetical protein [Pseudomonadota bacterium]
MRQIFICFLTIIFISSCASDPAKTNNELENLRFIDVDTFDQDLSKSMEADTEAITISMIGNVSVNKIPERLGRWLNVVTSKTGKVDFEPTTPPKPVDEKTTGSLSVAAIISLLPTAYDLLKDEFSYSSATNYNAIIYYKPDSGLLETIVFRKKSK